MVPNPKRSNAILKYAIMRTLRNPDELRKPSMNKIDSNSGWTSDAGKEQAYVGAYGVLHNLLVR